MFYTLPCQNSPQPSDQDKLNSIPPVSIFISFYKCSPMWERGGSGGRRQRLRGSTAELLIHHTARHSPESVWTCAQVLQWAPTSLQSSRPGQRGSHPRDRRGAASGSANTACRTARACAAGAQRPNKLTIRQIRPGLSTRRKAEGRVGLHYQQNLALRSKVAAWTRSARHKTCAPRSYPVPPGAAAGWPRARMSERHSLPGGSAKRTQLRCGAEAERVWGSRRQGQGITKHGGVDSAPEPEAWPQPQPRVQAAPHSEGGHMQTTWAL